MTAPDLSKEIAYLEAGASTLPEHVGCVSSTHVNKEFLPGSRRLDTP